MHTPAALADAVAAQATEAAATAAGLLFRDLTIDFPLNISIVRSYADAGKPGARGRVVTVHSEAPDQGRLTTHRSAVYDATSACRSAARSGSSIRQPASTQRSDRSIASTRAAAAGRIDSVSAE